MTQRLRNSISTICATTLVATGLAQAPTPASADGDFLKGLAVGIGGAIIVNEANKKKNNQTKKVVRQTAPSGPRPTIATFPTTRDQVRDYQARLNTLGFNAGVPDGLYGGKTRSAVSQFQMNIGSAATGVLTEADASILLQQSNQFAQGLATAGTTNAFTAATQPGAFPAPQPVIGGAQVPGAAGQLAVAPTPTFPALGGTNPAAAQPGLPAPVAPGTGQVAAAPGATFPTIGATGQAAPSAAPTFPTIGAPETQAPGTGAPAFPQVGAAVPQGTLAAAPSTGTAAPASTFPAIGAPAGGTAVAQAAPTFPSVPATGQEPQADAGAMVALAAVPQVELPTEPSERFSILGISTGQSLDTAMTLLASEGYSSCKTIETITHCLTAAGANQDIVSLHAMPMADGTKQVAALSRRITFGQPIQTAQLSGMMADRYAGLLQAPGNIVGTADCLSDKLLTEGGSSDLAEVIMLEKSAGLASIVDNCGHFSRIVFGDNSGQDAVDQLSIFLFDGTVFAASPERPTAQAPIKF
jgi:peptidoglycan hydrolase-like protein with peptidoglycan-binding domain